MNYAIHMPDQRMSKWVCQVNLLHCWHEPVDISYLATDKDTNEGDEMTCMQIWMPQLRDKWIRHKRREECGGQHQLPITRKTVTAQLQQDTCKGVSVDV